MKLDTPDIMLGTTGRSRPKTCVPISGWGYGLGAPTATSSSCTTGSTTQRCASGAKVDLHENQDDDVNAAQAVKGKRGAQQKSVKEANMSWCQSGPQTGQYQLERNVSQLASVGGIPSRCTCKDKDFQIKRASNVRKSASDFLTRENSELKVHDLAEGVTGQQLISFLLQNDEQTFLQSHRDAGATGKHFKMTCLELETFHLEVLIIMLSFIQFVLDN